MNSSNAFFIGIDRSDKHLDFTVLDGTGKVIERGKVSTDPAALHPWMETWRERVAVGGRIVVAFEQPAPNLIVFFSQFEGVVGIYPLNPAAVRSYCRSFALSNAHSDRTDAAMIAATHSIIMVNCGRSNAPAARCATCAAWSSIGAPS
jgi:hypothetical protein